MTQLVNFTNGKVLVNHLSEAKSFWRRFRGLMFTNTFPKGNGLHIEPCRQIHTFFMKYPIDVLYLNREGQIVGIDIDLQTWKFGKKYSEAVSVIELPTGTIRETETEIGQYVKKIKRER